MAPGYELLSRWNREICSKEGVFREIKSRRYYEKPSDRRRRKAKEAIRALRKKARQAARRRS